MTQLRDIVPGVLYSTSHVGSLPQPRELRLLRKRIREGDASAREEYRVLGERFTKEWMSWQEKIGIDLPAGGEFLREDMAAYFGQYFGGTLLDFVPSYENRRYRPVEYAGKVASAPPFLREAFQRAQSYASRPIKETITGPATLADWAVLRYPPYYRDRRLFRRDLARALREQIDALVSAGMKVLQVDEPALTTKRRSLDDDLGAIAETVAGLEDRLYLILHICYSTYEALEVAWRGICALPFHQIHMEMANRNYALLPLIERYGLGEKDLGLGVVDVHTDRIESPEEIVAGVERVRRIVPDEKIQLLPDCGLKERTDPVAKAKLEAMVAAAGILRAKYRSARG
ncbi:MAG: cobalamin-independent methionine synthase II family protein [candidate division NC10 bacterium]|nr:cobalamin-independent methionine synthase II family protein [candidate division NC10 bacterium]